MEENKELTTEGTTERTTERTTEKETLSSCVVHNTDIINLKVQVQVLKNRLDNVDGELSKLKDTVQSGFAELKDMFLAYKHRNHVTEFLHDNWKWVVLIISLGVGEPAVKVLQVLTPVLFK